MTSSESLDYSFLFLLMVPNISAPLRVYMLLNFWRPLLRPVLPRPVRATGITDGFSSRHIWARSQNCDCLVTWFCYQLIVKPGNKTAAVSWPDPYDILCQKYVSRAGAINYFSLPLIPASGTLILMLCYQENSICAHLKVTPYDHIFHTFWVIQLNIYH